MIWAFWHVIHFQNYSSDFTITQLSFSLISTVFRTNFLLHAKWSSLQNTQQKFHKIFSDAGGRLKNDPQKISH